MGCLGRIAWAGSPGQGCLGRVPQGAAADGRCWQLLAAAPEAARAGLGDVLAGYAAGRGAQAQSTNSADGSLLAAVALAHAQAGLACLERLGPGGVSPLAVAAELRQA